MRTETKSSGDKTSSQLVSTIDSNFVPLGMTGDRCFKVRSVHFSSALLSTSSSISSTLWELLIQFTDVSVLTVKYINLDVFFVKSLNTVYGFVRNPL
jgi:hypothetical protein